MSRETPVDNDALLRRHGMQVTVQRLTVLREVSDRPNGTSRMAAVGYAGGDTPCLTATDKSGYEIDEAGASTGADAPSVSRQPLSGPAAEGGHVGWNTNPAGTALIQSSKGQEQ